MSNPQPVSVTDDLMSGAEFLASLRDGRAVYLYGERVADVTTHPAFRNSAASLARLYDALRDPDQREALTTVDRYGIRTQRAVRAERPGLVSTLRNQGAVLESRAHQPAGGPQSAGT